MPEEDQVIMQDMTKDPDVQFDRCVRVIYNFGHGDFTRPFTGVCERHVLDCKTHLSVRSTCAENLSEIEGGAVFHT